MVTTYRKVTLAALTSAALLFALAGGAAANTGNVAASETCSTWGVSVSLNHNVTSDRTVVVLTTIPGTVGIAGNHYDTSFGQIWSASGPAPATGTVTLEIYYNDSSLEYTTSASIAPVLDCATPTPTPTPTPTATPFQSFQGETATPTPKPTPTPFESFQGETATPTMKPSPAPFQSVQGETATPVRALTPPPTGSSNGSSGSSSTPLLALVISLALGGLGLAAVEAQRRSIRR